MTRQSRPALAQNAASQFAIGIALCLAGAATQARAQDAPAAENAAPVAGDILVTARKRTETVQRVPTTISVVGPEALAATSSTSLLELPSVVSGINITRPGIGNEVGITIRGLGSDAFEPSFHTSVGLFADEIYIPHNRGFAASMFDVERIEVIRGTQSALLGRNSTLGAVKLVSRKPGNEFAADFRTSYEFERGSTQFASGVDIPIAENLAVRVAGLVSDDQGWVYNRISQDYGANRKDTAYRAVLRWQPSDSLDITAIAQHGVSQNHGLAIEFIDDNGGTAEFLAALAGYPGVVDEKLDLVTAYGGKIRPIDRLESDRYSLAANLQLGDYTLTSTTGYYNYHENDIHDVDILPGDYYQRIVNESGRQFSQELRIASPTDRPFDFIAGVSYLHEKFDNKTVYDLNYPFGPAPGVNLAGAFRVHLAQDTDVFSVFGQANYKFTEQLHISLGGRWTDERKDGNLGREIVKPGLVSLVAFPPYAPFPVKRTDNSFDYSASVQYDVSTNAMLFASYSKGTKAGGFALTPMLLQNAGYGRETAKTAEIGLKLQDAGRRWLFNISAFNTNVDDFQQVLIKGPVVVVESADLRSRGVELEAYWRPIAGLQIRLSNTYADVKNKTTGEPAPIAPKWSGSAGIDYRAGINRDVDFILDGSVDYRSRRYYLPTDTTPSGAPFTPINISLALAKHDDSWEVRLIGRNITNELALASAGPAPGMPFGSIGIAERSRTIALQLSGRF
ncbi:MAG TPA: TonB-dependent receptor [Nitrospira sp.]